MMKFIPIDFPPELFLPKSESTGGFIADVLPQEKMEAVGWFQPPMFWWDPDDEINKKSQDNNGNYPRVLKK